MRKPVVEEVTDWICATFDDVVGDRAVVLFVLIALVLVLTGVVSGLWSEA